jgi:pimeloyl-ACP methyl ester carboxylesterase
MGGYVAMAFLRRHADRVAGLALLSTHAGADDARHRTEREIFAKLVLDPRSRKGVITAATAKLLGATTRTRRAQVVARVQEHVAVTAPESIAWCQRAIATRPDSFDVLRATDVPSVVLTGEEDELVPVAEAARMADALPRGRLVTVPDAGHLVPMERPEVVTTALADLVRGNGKTGC